MRNHAEREVALADITVLPDRLRQLRPEVVASLAESLTAQGLLQPIVIRPGEAAGHILVAGWHRLEAAQQLGWKTIRAHVLPEGASLNSLLLAEIDENLIRADLSPAERAAHMATRKQVYERLYPQTRHGGDRRSSRKVYDLKDGDRFTAEVAGKTARSERAIQLDAHRGETIGTASLARITGTSLDKGEELDALVKVPVARRAALIDRAAAGERVSAKTEAKKVRREFREQELAAKQLALPDKVYGVIVEDYEWDDETWSEKGKDRHASNHYPTSADAHTAEEIVARTKDRFLCAGKDCILLMWTTNQHLAIAIDVLRLRGFDYKSNYCWGKDYISMGRWNRSKHELLLIGVRGNVPCPAPGTQWDSLIMAPKGRHSEKPEAFLRMVEEYFPSIPKIELNARRRRPGWASHGNELTDELPAEISPENSDHSEEPA